MDLKMEPPGTRDSVGEDKEGFPKMRTSEKSRS